MTKRDLDGWLDLVPKPRPLASNQKWHIYLSYRSIDRPWVLQLYDVLKGLGYAVFLDRYVVQPGQPIIQSLLEEVEQSAAAVLIWSSRTEDSEWSAGEFQKLQQLSQQNPHFRFVTVVIDYVHLPAYLRGTIFVDFSEFREGPTGSRLLQLLYALQGQPLPPEAIALAAQIDTETKDSLSLIRATRSVGQVGRLLELAQRNTLAWQTSPSLLCQVIEALTSLGQSERALEIAERCIRAFPRAIRPQQLKALTLARLGEWQPAQMILTRLYQNGERDAETLGILARTWMDRYQSEKNISLLRRSRDLYLEAFRAAPDDYYVGINAASKSAMLGELDAASAYAKEVETLVGSKSITGDYWKTATIAEVRLLQKDFSGAAQLYRDAVSQDPLALGSHESTYRQALLLLDLLGPTPQQRSLVLSAFAHLSHAQTPDPSPPFQPQPADRAMAAKLLFALVARRHAEPDLINSLDPAKFWEALRKTRPGATRDQLAALSSALGGSESGHPSPLWLAWLETARSADLDKLLQ